MKLGKGHLVASVALLVGAILYNVWVFTRPATPVGVNATALGPVNVPAPIASADGRLETQFDPTQIKPLPDVALDRQPEWPRDPFLNLRSARPVPIMADAPPPVAEAAPDPVVASILYSADRRLATVDGRIVRVGDQVGDAVVVDILPNAVVIESPDRGRRTLTMAPPAGFTAR